MKIFTLALSLVAAGGFLASPLAAEEESSRVAAASKLKTIEIPKIDFREATVREALEFLAGRTLNLDPEGAGVNFILKTPVEGEVSDSRITLALTKVPVGEVVKYVAKLADGTVRVDPAAVVVTLPEKGKRLEDHARAEVPIADGVKMDEVVKPLQDTKIPRVSFHDSTVAETFDFISQRAKALLPGGKGINVVLTTGAKDRKVTLTGNNMSIIDALRYTAELAGLELSIEKFAIVVSDPKGK